MMYYNIILTRNIINVMCTSQGHHMQYRLIKTLLLTHPTAVYSHVCRRSALASGTERISIMSVAGSIMVIACK